MNGPKDVRRYKATLVRGELRLGTGHTKDTHEVIDYQDHLAAMAEKDAELAAAHEALGSKAKEWAHSFETIARQAKVIERLKTQRSILVSFSYCGDLLTEETLERMNQELESIEQKAGEKGDE